MEPATPRASRGRCRVFKEQQALFLKISLMLKYTLSISMRIRKKKPIDEFLTLETSTNIIRRCRFERFPSHVRTPTDFGRSAEVGAGGGREGGPPPRRSPAPAN
ncbi:hypothetical protein EVAR_7388_1 [Eumeta japonica]|uniref:Uncharacterized protein n=1 Tax=Eumeta variegata TaxID=151549 RepID=A0A4C1V7N4_EUMVA|nr:hypothetical protein EVAR_7388_1 [Eumeta japonica]